MSGLLTVVLARHGSERLPGKVVADVCGTPLLAWTIRRLTHSATGISKPGTTIVATTDGKEDDEVEAVARTVGVMAYRHAGDPNDVVGRVHAVVAAVPSARWVFVALADCPFLDTGLVRRCHFALRKWGGDTTIWYLPPNVFPIYGAREMPWSRRAINLIHAGARGWEREHAFAWFNLHREQFEILYHDPPEKIFFPHPHAMRLEVDWPEDLEVVRVVARDGPGMLAPLEKVIRWLYKHEDVARLNADRVERSGPIRSYNDDQRVGWFRLMRDAKMVTWDNELRIPPKRGQAYQIQCSCGGLLGWGHQGVLYHVDGHEVRDGFVRCAQCGTGLNWLEKKESNRGR